MSKRFLFTQVEIFTYEKLEAKVQEIKDNNDKEMALLIGSFLPSEWDQMLEWLAIIIGESVCTVAAGIDLALTLGKMTEIIVNDLEVDKLNAKLSTMKKSDVFRIYTDVYEWLSGSGNHFSYITEHRYD